MQIVTFNYALEHIEHYIIISGCKLLKIFERMLKFNSNEPIKVVNFRKKANRPMLNGAIAFKQFIVFINNYFYECKKNIVPSIKRETF